MDLSPTPAEAELRDEIRAWLRANLPWEYGKGLPPRFDDLADEVAFGREWQAKLASGRLGRRRLARASTAAGARGPVEHYIVTEELAAAARRSSSAASASTSSARRCSRTAPPSRRRGGCRRSSTRRRSGASCSASRARAATSRRCATRGRHRSTAASCSTARRCGRATRSSPTGAGASRAPIPTRRRTRASPRSSSTCTRRASRCGRCARSPTSPSSTRCSSPTCSCPTDRLVGPLHEGWRIANSTLTHERGVNPRQLVIHSQLVDELWRLALERGAFDDPRLAPRLAEAFVEVRMFQLHNWRSISRTAKGEDPGPVGSINKLWWSEMSKRLHDTAMAVLGTGAAAVAGRRRQPGRRRLAAVVALLPGQLDLGRHQRDPAQRHRRAGARPSPRTALNATRRLLRITCACLRTTSKTAPSLASLLARVRRTRSRSRSRRAAAAAARRARSSGSTRRHHDRRTSRSRATAGEGRRDRDREEQRRRRRTPSPPTTAIVRRQRRRRQDRDVHGAGPRPARTSSTATSTRTMKATLDVTVAPLSMPVR